MFVTSGRVYPVRVREAQLFQELGTLGSVEGLSFPRFRCASHSWTNVYCSLGKFNPVRGSGKVYLFI